PPRAALHERDVRARGLKVEEALGLDLGEPIGLPRLREIAPRERGALAAVVPASKGGDENRLPQRGPGCDAEFLSDRPSLRSAARRASPARSSPPRRWRPGRRGATPAPTADGCAIGAPRGPSAGGAHRTRPPRAGRGGESDRGGRRGSRG